MRRCLVEPEKIGSFGKVFIKAGEKINVKITLDKSAFEFYLPPIKDFYVENGEFEIMVGSASSDIRLAEKIEITK